jgi:hypothetical protein
MIIGITIGIFAALTICISSSFQPGAASIANQSNVTTLSIPVADTPFYRENLQSQVEIQSMPLMWRCHYPEMEY